MKFKRSGRGLIFTTFLLLCTLFLLSWLILSGAYLYITFVVPVILFQLYDFYKGRMKALDELNQFTGAARYRDFSRHYDIRNSVSDLIPFHENYNQLNSIFREIGKEKETQYQFLQTILGFIDTGILSYNISSGEIEWSNEAVKKILGIPYFRTIASIEKRNPDVYAAITGLETGINTIVSISRGGETQKILVTSVLFNTGNVAHKLISFKNINEAIEITESDAWKKLLSVLTHEIMNSVAPISSLSGTLAIKISQMMEAGVADGGMISDLKIGIDAIKRRSEGLLKFTGTYRSLYKIDKAILSEVPVFEVLNIVQQLLQPLMEKKNIRFEVVIKNPMLRLMMDASLIEQALINLVLNAIDAVKGVAEPAIILEIRQFPDHRTSLRVIDNGEGVSDEVADRIFVPFFSTKQTGSGIGLNVCKQIMLLHKGSISVESKSGTGSVFSLNF